MKIAVIGPASVNHTVKVINFLSNQNHEVFLFSQINHKEGADRINDKVNIVYLKRIGLLGYFLNVSFLRKSLDEIKPDIVNVNFASGYGTLFRLTNNNCPSVLSVWGSDIFSFPNKNFLTKRVLISNLSFFTCIVSTSQIMAKETKKYFIGFNKRIEVIPFGVDLTKFKSYDNENDTNSFIKIICVKSLKPIYGIEDLLMAIKILNDKNIKIKADIYGEGNLLNKLNKLTKKLSISHLVEFKGYIENKNVPKALNNSDICCIPSHRESFGVSVLEAMACKLPIVATKTDGFQEIIEDGSDGLLVEINSPYEIANKIEYLINNPRLMKDLANKSRIKVESLYDLEKNLKELENLFKNLCFQKNDNR